MKTYFIKNDVNSCIKIGRTEDIEKRFRSLQTCAGFAKLTLFHLLEGDYENLFHKYYKDQRITGEWFDLPDITIEQIEELSIKFSTNSLIEQSSIYGIRSALSFKLCLFLLKLSENNVVEVTKRVKQTFMNDVEQYTGKTITEQTFYKCMKELTKARIVTKLTRGSYFMNPQVLWKDDKDKRVEFIREEMKSPNGLAYNPKENIKSLGEPNIDYGE